MLLVRGRIDDDNDVKSILEKKGRMGVRKIKLQVGEGDGGFLYSKEKVDTLLKVATGCCLLMFINLKRRGRFLFLTMIDDLD